MVKEKRSEYRVPVNMVLNKYINGEPHLCRAVNVSRGGILLRKVLEPDVVHHSVTLEFQLPGTAQVLRVDGVALMDGAAGRTVGVRFTKMSADAAATLDQFLYGVQEPAQRRHV